MNQIKEDIIEILMAIYKIPGQYFIAGIILFAFWNGMKDLTNWAIVFLLFGIFFFSLEIISPILAGKRLYENLVKWWRKHLK
jgi:site-specific recombinase